MIAGHRHLVVLGVVAVTTPSTGQSADAFAAGLDAQWDFSRPAVSEQRFRAELAKWPADSPEPQEVRTQLARALGLQRQFDAAHMLGISAPPSKRRGRDLKALALAEIARSRGDTRTARPWVEKAHAALKDDSDLAANEAPRLARLAAMAADNAPAAAKA